MDNPTITPTIHSNWCLRVRKNLNLSLNLSFCIVWTMQKERQVWFLSFQELQEHMASFCQVLSFFDTNKWPSPWIPLRKDRLKVRAIKSIWMITVMAGFECGHFTTVINSSAFRCVRTTLKSLKFLTYTAMPNVCVTWKRGAWLCSWAGLRGPTGLRLDQKWILESRGLGVSSRPDGVYINKTQNEMSEDKYTKMEMMVFILAVSPESCSESVVKLSYHSVSPRAQSQVCPLVNSRLPDRQTDLADWLHAGQEAPLIQNSKDLFSSVSSF